ncbi:hypothetical protein MKW94_008994 [Papaver nudicaule]|uniref:Uncharacterized protein n=1 Tax=Papaver nudicaule TaxID=74823 RepID=A0AA41VFV5_PAPNU|nr:hypothetical protein [Papaver nudicaule]
MEQWSSSMERRHDEPEFNLREWAVKARNVSRENTKSRRFSAPNITSFREMEAKSFRSTTTISSTVSSPGYTLTEEIDPSTYSFTSALKALQAKTGYGWEWLSPDGVALSSKWNEAEKYICNPFSGEFPAECLSAKTLRRRSMSSSTNKFSMSAPLDYSSRPPISRSKSITAQDHKETDSGSTIQEEMVENLKQDMESTTPSNHNSSNPDPDGSSSTAPSTTNHPPVEEKRLIMQYEVKGREEPIISTIKPQFVDDQDEGNETSTTEKDEKTKEKVIIYRCYSWKASCLPWKKWMMKSKTKSKKIGKPVQEHSEWMD